MEQPRSAASMHFCGCPCTFISRLFYPATLPQRAALRRDGAAARRRPDAAAGHLCVCAPAGRGPPRRTAGPPCTGKRSFFVSNNVCKAWELLAEGRAPNCWTSPPRQALVSIGGYVCKAWELLAAGRGPPRRAAGPPRPGKSSAGCWLLSAAAWIPLLHRRFSCVTTRLIMLRSPCSPAPAPAWPAVWC